MKTDKYMTVAVVTLFQNGVQYKNLVQEDIMNTRDQSRLVHSEDYKQNHRLESTLLIYHCKMDVMLFYLEYV